MEGQQPPRHEGLFRRIAASAGWFVLDALTVNGTTPAGYADYASIRDRVRAGIAEFSEAGRDLPQSVQQMSAGDESRLEI